MASSSALLKLTCVLLLCMVIAAPFAVEATVSCGQVASSLGPCIVYLRGNGGPVPGGCCAGVKKLNGAAQTTVDKQEACRCMTSAASRISGINFGLAASLPKNCGVNIPYKISPSTDCNKVK